MKFKNDLQKSWKTVTIERTQGIVVVSFSIKKDKILYKKNMSKLREVKIACGTFLSSSFQTSIYSKLQSQIL